MNRPLPAPVLQYLKSLEPLLKARYGVFVEEALSDTREYLVNDYDALHQSEPGIDDQAVLQHFIETYGPPEQVATQYGEAEGHRKRKGNAPGWRVCCTRCGRSAPASEIGMIRIGARSLHKYIGGWCSHCRRLRWIRVIRDLEQTNLTDRLAMNQTPDQVISRMHKPWLVVASILLLVGVILGGTWLVEIWLKKPQPAKPREPTSSSSFTPELTPASNTAFDGAIEHLPEGWTLSKKVSVTTAQLATFSQKLGSKILRLDNFFLHHASGKSVQLNVIETDSAAAAKQIAVTLRKSKSNARLASCRGKFAYELVARDTDQIKLALLARYELNLIPSESTYHVSLDLAPISQFDAAKGNELFNYCIAFDRGQADASKSIEQIARHATLSNTLLLRTSKNSTWTFDPMPIQSDDADPSGLKRFELKDLPRKAGLPFVKCSARIASTTPLITPNDTRDQTRWLKSTPRWPVEAPTIQERAKQITQNAVSTADKLKNLLDWSTSSRGLRYGGEVIGSRYGTLEALKQGYGRCWDFADVFVTLARASGIPCRQVHGWLHESEGHIWVEVLTERGWEAYDPTTGMHCGADYIPFSFSDDGETTYVLASAVKIEQVDN